MSKKEDEIGLEIHHPEITERKPPNDKIIAFEVEEHDENICTYCNTKNLKQAKFCSDCGKRF